MSYPGVYDELMKAKESNPLDYVDYDSDQEW